MDSNGDKKRITLGDVKFIAFYEALISGNHEPLGIPREQYFDLCERFLSLSGEKKNPLEKQLEKILTDLSILRACMVLLIKKFDQDLADICLKHNVEVKEEALNEGIDAIVNKIQELEKKYKLIASQRPPAIKSDQELTPYEILATLSVGLEFNLDFQKITALEYISYKKVLKQKQEAIKSTR